MKVLLAASEAVPFIKTGGLADVMGALPAKLRREGVETALVIPKYSRVAERFGSQMETVWEGTVDLAWRRQYVGVEKIVLDGVPVFFIDNEYYFKRDGLYGFYDDGERFAYFCRALLAMLPHIGFRPDVIHSNDWHTGLVGVYLKEDFQKDPFYQGMKSLFTIHNMKYQGIFSPEVVEDVLGLSRSLFDSGRIENNGCVNYLKAGMEYADAVNTVSPSYAEEIQYPYFGEGLDGYVRLCRGKITGILNGMDEKAYDPAEDPRIPYGYTDKDVFIRKPLDKEALQKELGLPVNRRIPVFAMISRLVEAKGLDLLTCIMDEMLQEDVQAHRVYAGADFFLMPSRYEACGLSQMISMKYGTIPVVHATGGLKDSVQDFQKFTGEGNGLSFAHFNAHELLFTIKRGLSDYEEDTVWEKLVLNAMHSDNSWDRSARAYKALYEKLAGRREEAPAPRLTLKEADMPLPEKPAGDGIRAKAAGTRKKTVRKTTERKKPVRKATVRKAVRKKPEFR